MLSDSNEPVLKNVDSDDAVQPLNPNAADSLFADTPVADAVPSACARRAVLTLLTRSSARPSSRVLYNGPSERFMKYGYKAVDYFRVYRP